MSIRNLIILSQLNPPAQRSRILLRQRVIARLSAAIKYPVTVIEAGTGYGKSTAVLSFVQGIQQPIYWFTISGTDRDPRLFLAKLFTAFNQHGEGIGDEALRILEMADATPQEAMIAFLNAISVKLTRESFFILDDFHSVRDIPEIMALMDWMVEHLPSIVHLILITRSTLNFPSMNKWRVKGMLLEISKDDLTFTRDEILQLFESQYGIDLTESTLDDLIRKTEGWAIGLQMVWQTVQNNPHAKLQEVLEDEQRSRTALFDYLADEVLAGLDVDRQTFLLETSILSKLDSATCDFLLTSDSSEKVLRELHNSGFFIEELRPGVYRYHQIFREFLLNRLQQNPGLALERHRKVASYFRAHEYWEEAIFHLLASGDYHQINQILESIGDRLIKEGRQESINYWIHEIPQTVWRNYPHLLYLLGEVNRYLGHFEDALEYYHTAERLYRQNNNRVGLSSVLKGQGQVYLDTIRPSSADQLLQDALKLLDPVEMKTEVADLLVLTAENQLNLGLPDSAEALLAQASHLRSDLDMETDLIQSRILLRTGRLQQGVDLLKDRESSAATVPPSRPQRFHRESTLLLSLFHAIMGDYAEAERYAMQGIEIGRLLQSTFVQAVGFMRLGHAISLHSMHPFKTDSFEQAMQYYQESIDKIDVVRIHVEPLWGMCRALGLAHQIRQAEQLAIESLEIASKAGDIWISILIQISLGMGELLSGNPEAAQHYLTTAESSSIKVKDPFTLSASRLWLALRAWRQGYANTALGYLEKVLKTVQEHDYLFLLTQESLLGLMDREAIYPLLIAAAEADLERPFIEELLKLRGLEEETYHPGYTLWVRTFGSFKVWRSDQLIEPQEWKRGKARQLFQLLIANRDRWLSRDQLTATLWADAPAENASGYLKVILNALNQVIEPDRPRGATPYFIERQQDLYRLNPNARIIVDSELFIDEIQNGTLASLHNAVMLYQGHYFEDSCVQEWLMSEEQYYHQQFLLASERLTRQLIETEAYEKALAITHMVLAQDGTWESAYRSQMLIFHAMGRPSMVGEVFQRCQDVYRRQFDSDVSPETANLYQALKS